MIRRAASWAPLGLALLAVVAACTSTGYNQGDFNLISVEEEWQLGSRLERDLARELDLVNDRVALAYVNDLGRRLVAGAHLGDRPWEFHIVRDGEINAFNIPGGHVYINTGLVAAADRVSELAGVMAHEVAHGVSRHATEQMSKSYGFNILASLALGENPSTYESLLAQITGAGTFAHFSREAEREADRWGVRAMVDAGYDPEGMATMFETLLRQRQSRPGAVQQFFASHPLTESRIQEVRRMASGLSTADLISRDREFDRIQKRLR